MNYYGFISDPTISSIKAILADLGLESEFVDTHTEVPLLNLKGLGFDLGLPDPESKEFDNFTLGVSPDGVVNVDDDLFVKGDLFFLLRYVYQDMFLSVGWDSKDVTSGNGECPILEVEKFYPFDGGVNYVVICPNSHNDNPSNEEFNAFEVVVVPKGVEYETNEEEYPTQKFKTINEVVDFIYGEE